VGPKTFRFTLELRKKYGKARPVGHRPSTPLVARHRCVGTAIAGGGIIIEEQGGGGREGAQSAKKRSWTQGPTGGFYRQEGVNFTENSRKTGGQRLASTHKGNVGGIRGRKGPKKICALGVKPGVKKKYRLNSESKTAAKGAEKEKRNSPPKTAIAG